MKDDEKNFVKEKRDFKHAMISRKPTHRSSLTSNRDKEIAEWATLFDDDFGKRVRDVKSNFY